MPRKIRKLQTEIDCDVIYITMSTKCGIDGTFTSRDVQKIYPDLSIQRICAACHFLESDGYITTSKRPNGGGYLFRIEK